MTTTANLIDLYVSERLALGEIVESSAGVIASVLRHWWRAGTGYAELDEWTELMVLAWVFDENARANTRKSRLHKLRCFVRWLIARGDMAIDPTARVSRITSPDGDPRDLAVDDARRLLSFVADLRGRVIVLLMLHIGLRCGDVARIRIEDIDRRRRSLHVRAKNGRGEYTHWDPIPDEAFHELERLLREIGRHTGPLIRSYTTGHAMRPASIGKLVGEWMTEAGIKQFPYDGISAHALRHTCAQHMLDDGADIRQVQKALGHRTIRSTELYSRREPAGLREAMGRRTYLRVVAA